MQKQSFAIGRTKGGEIKLVAAGDRTSQMVDAAKKAVAKDFTSVDVYRKQRFFKSVHAGGKALTVILAKPAVPSPAAKVAVPPKTDKAAAAAAKTKD